MTENPFASNPDTNSGSAFADPSIQQARSGNLTNAGIRTEGLDDYNPFATGQQPRPAAKSGGGPPPTGQPGGQPAVLPPSETSYGRSGSGAGQPPAAAAASVAELERRQRDLDARAAELDRREQSHLLSSQGDRGGGGAAGNNWPPLPGCCPVKPCFRQDFQADFEDRYRPFVKTGYYLWMAYSVVLLLNILGTLAHFIKSKDTAKSGAAFGTAILLFLIFTPASFVCWYRPLYKALRNDSSFNFFIFFFVFLAQFIVVVIQALGIDVLASCGWINGLATLGEDRTVAAIMLILASLFSLVAAADILFLIKVHRLYRSSGASFEKAREEFSHGVATNETVRNTASDFGAAAARGAVSGATGAAGAR